jgi:hypothetical protein
VPGRGGRNDRIGAQDCNQRGRRRDLLVEPHDGEIDLSLAEQNIIVVQAGRGHELEAHAGASRLEHPIERAQYGGVLAILRPRGDAQLHRLGP